MSRDALSDDPRDGRERESRSSIASTNSRSTEQIPEARERIAERHGLSLRNGKIPVPDMRIEHDTAAMERKHLDLELATRNHRPRALDEREITAQILPL